MKRVTGPAGTAIVFTEAMAHGTLPWTGDHERRTLFFKYSPHWSSWYARYYNADDYPSLTDRQRAILEPPNDGIPTATSGLRGRDPKISTQRSSDESHRSPTRVLRYVRLPGIPWGCSLKTSTGSPAPSKGCGPITAVDTMGGSTTASSAPRSSSSSTKTST